MEKRLAAELMKKADEFFHDMYRVRNKADVNNGCIQCGVRSDPTLFTRDGYLEGAPVCYTCARDNCIINAFEHITENRYHLPRPQP